MEMMDLNPSSSESCHGYRYLQTLLLAFENSDCRFTKMHCTSYRYGLNLQYPDYVIRTDESGFLLFIYI
jgi:hypothetical protein